MGSMWWRVGDGCHYGKNPQSCRDLGEKEYRDLACRDRLAALATTPLA